MADYRRSRIQQVLKPKFAVTKLRVLFGKNKIQEPTNVLDNEILEFNLNFQIFKDKCSLQMYFGKKLVM